MHAKPFRRSVTRRSAVVLGALALVGASSVTAGATSVAAGAVTPSPQAAAERGSYVAIVRQGTMRHLRIVSRSNGRVLRHVASARAAGGEEPILDVDLASDGSVWAVVLDRSLPQPYQTRLKRFTSGRTVRSLPYVTSVRVSPDNRRLAVSVLSPDGDGDGRGLSALRVATTSGKVVSTLSSTKFPVDRKSGWPIVEIGGLAVQGWLGTTELLVRDGCCDEGNISIVSARTPSKAQRWPTFHGSGSTMAIGTRGNRVLVVAERWAGDGTEQNPYHADGIQTFWMTKAKPAGTLVSTVRGEDLDMSRHIDRLVRKAGAAPLWISPTRYPYRGSGSVIQAAL